MNPVRLLRPLRADKAFFELMRRVEAIDRVGNSARPVGRPLRRQPAWLTLEQSAELGFAAGEVDSVQLRSYRADSPLPEVLVRQRHFGLFAPYGPLPLYVTEHAMLQRQFERNAAFERFINMVSAQLAWNHYCAWSLLNPVLGYERERNAFAERVGRLSNVAQQRAADQSATAHESQHTSLCRAAFAGLYAARQRPLAPLRRMLSRYFQVPVQVLPRTGRWMAVPNRGTDPRRLGQWRVGNRVLDAQLQTQIVVGPLESQAWEQWKRKSPCVAALIAVTNDYTDGHIQPLVKVQIRTHSGMAGRLGAMCLGHDAWARPGDSIQTLTVYDSFQEPE